MTPSPRSPAPPVGVRPLQPGDAPWALALNRASVAMLSPLTPARFEVLRRSARHARAVGTEAFLLAFDETAPHDSPNFLWFRERYARFAYVDRIVARGASRRAGHARSLYRELLDAAAAEGRPVVCEVNLDPPNPQSDAFHRSLGFAAVGEARVGPKRVRYLSRAAGPA